MTVLVMIVVVIVMVVVIVVVIVLVMVIVVVMVLVMVIVVEWMRLQSSAMGGGSQLCLVTELHLLHLESSAPSLYFWSFGVSL